MTHFEWFLVPECIEFMFSIILHVGITLKRFLSQLMQVELQNHKLKTCSRGQFRESISWARNIILGWSLYGCGARMTDYKCLEESFHKLDL